MVESSANCASIQVGSASGLSDIVKDGILQPAYNEATLVFSGIQKQHLYIDGPITLETNPSIVSTSNG